MQETLVLNGAEPLHWAVGGAALALIVLAMLFFLNHRLGISTGFENICALGSKLPYFGRSELQGRGRWRLPFFIGLFGGGVLSAAVTGGWRPFWDLGLFDQAVGWGQLGKIGWMFAGGLLIGLGTRTAGGCTSGHGLFGLANFERSGLASVLAFMATGIITANIVYRLLFVL
jgi:hypothetical protein